MNSIEWLQTWYQAQCDNDWEHQYGVKIDSLDNPGWVVTIDLVGTPLQDSSMPAVGDLSQVNHSGLEGDQTWLNCKVESNQFVGAGGPTSLFAICEVFQRWAESQS